jgi:hypothetical protein
MVHPASTTSRVPAAVGSVGNEQGFGGGAVLLNPHFVSKEVAEKIVHGERLKSSRDRGDEGVVFRTQTGKEIRGEIVVIERLFGSSKGGGNLLDPLKVVGDRGVALLGSSELVMKAHGVSTSGGGENMAESSPELLGSAAIEYLGKKFIGDGGHEHAENELILAKPLESCWVSGDCERPICRSGRIGVRWCFGTIHKAVEIVPVKVCLNLMMSDKKIGLG